MKTLALPALLLAAGAAQALDPACETFIAVNEKTSQQPARQSVNESSGMRLEAITLDGKSWTRIDGGAWKAMTIDLLAAEKEINADIRSGKIPLKDCKELGSEDLDGVSMRVISYSISMFGLPAVASKVYIGKDGLIYAQSSKDMKVRYRYTGVSAPK